MHVRLDSRLGTDLAGYRIEAVLGRGGMGVVYRATDPRLKRPVALKLLALGRAEDPRFRERFLRESELAAWLDHSHVIPIYEAGEAEGLLHIAMRYGTPNDIADGAGGGWVGVSKRLAAASIPGSAQTSPGTGSKRSLVGAAWGLSTWPRICASSAGSRSS